MSEKITQAIGSVLSFALLAALAAGAYDLSQPAQVEAITYTVEGANLHFKRPMLFNLSGRADLAHLRLGQNAFVPQALLAGSVIEHNRGQAFVCGGSLCSFSNTVWLRYQEAQTQRETAQRAAGTAQQTLVQLAERQQAQEVRMQQEDCATKLQWQPPERHVLACAPGEERLTSQAICLVTTMGPDACAKQVKDSVFGQIAASEMCSTVVSVMMDQERTSEERQVDATFGLLTAGSDAAIKSCKEGQLLSCLLVPHAFAFKLVDGVRKVQVFDECVPKAVGKCQTVYRQWQAKMDHFKATYGPAIAVCSDLSANVNQLKRQREDVQSYQTEMEAVVSALSQKMQDLQTAREVVRF